MKPFNFEEFKAGKPAMLDGKTFHFLAYDEQLQHPLVVREGRFAKVASLEEFERDATMLPTKREVWIAICKHGEQDLIEPDDVFYDSKDLAMNSKHEGAWQVIDAIPYTIEE